VKIDYIVKEELLRSLAIYWILFLIIAIPTVGGYLPLSTASAFPLAAILTAIYFCVMVWYRRNENLHDPNPISILRHALRSGEQREEKTKQRRAIVEKAVDAFLVVTIFLIYLYASFAYSISQIYWLPVLILIGLFLARIIFTDGGERRVTLLPLLQAIVLVGIITFPILYIWERRRTPKGKD